MLKPALARGEIKLIGATTLDEYRQHIEKDEAFARRMQPVLVEEPDVASAISIMRGLKRRYEAHHGVTIQDAAIVLAVKLAKRYIVSRKLPDSGIDLLDEACARVRVQLDSKPEEIDRLERKELQLKIEATALESEADTMSKLRLQKVKDELAGIRESLNSLRSKLELETSRVEKLADAKRRVEKLQRELEAALQASDLERAARIQYGDLPATQKEVEDMARQQEASLADSAVSKLVTEVVGPDEVASVVSRWTGIPVTKLTANDRSRLLRLDDHLHETVVGQDRAVKAVAQAVLRSRGGLSAPNRPASFLFLGPTGTGKTLLAKALARELFDDEKHMVRIDCSELMEKHSVSKLIGAPPGYVGFDTNAGQLTEAVRRRGHTVVLFDEIEKADRSILTVLLQLLDDGRLTDSHGRVVDFSNTIVIMTSNIGSHLLLTDVAAHASDRDFAQAVTDATEAAVMREVQKAFVPEFLNRLDEVIVFEPLRKPQLRSIVVKESRALASRLEDRNIDVTVAAGAVEQILEEAYDPAFGARPIRRYIERYIGTELSRLIVAGELSDHMSVLVRSGGAAGADATSAAAGSKVFNSELARGQGRFTFVLTPKKVDLNGDGDSGAGGGGGAAGKAATAALQAGDSAAGGATAQLIPELK